ncbi:MAG: DNA mismatch repair protein MutS, partial [Hyphomicrobiales bacterium]|nr:DNA mismatch repair protein MutS [Hyphomicrobiales bacterium]
MNEGRPPPRHRLRRLTDEEIALWTEVARSVSRRRGASLPTPSKPLTPKPPVSAPTPSDPAHEPKPPKPRLAPLAPIERRLKRELERGRAA